MCGRYAASKSTDELVEELEVDADRTGEPVRSVLVRDQSPAAGEADWNMAPAKNARVVVTRPVRGEEGAAAGNGAASPTDATDSATERTLRLLSWGFVPGWAKDPKMGMRMINARVETLLEKRTYRKAALERRLLVPADGWYEWQVSPTALDAKGKPRKQPFYMTRTDGAPLTFGGVYSFWRDPEAEQGDPLAWLASFSIITQAAEPGLDRVHDRQPFVIDPSGWERWLDPARSAPEAVAALLTPEKPGRFEARPVGRAVGNMRNNGPQLLDAVDPAELEGVVDPTTGEIVG